MMKFDLHHFVSQVQICSSSLLLDTEILPARTLFFLLFSSTSCLFLALYFKLLSLCALGFLSFDPLKKLHTREM